MKRRKRVKESIPIPNVYLDVINLLMPCTYWCLSCLYTLIFALDSSTIKTTHSNNFKCEQKLIIDAMKIMMGNRQQATRYHLTFYVI